MFRVYALDDQSELKLADIVATIWGGRWWIAGLTLGLGLASVALSFVQDPVYRASVIMAPVVEERSAGGLASLAGQLTGLAGMTGLNLSGEDNTDEAIATLTSRAFTVRFIEEHELMPVLYADLWDPQTQSWKTEEGSEPPSASSAYTRFNNSIRAVAQDVQTGLVTLTVDWTDPLLAAEWANRLVADVNDALRRQAIQQSKNSIDYLKRELDQTREIELRNAVFGLIEVEMKKSMVATVKSEYAFKVIDPAVVPEKRYSPNRFLYLVLGSAIGLFIGLLVTFGRSSFSGKSSLRDA